MAERRDFDDIKLIAGVEEPLKIGGIKPEDLQDLESDLLGSVDLNSPDLSDDLLDDLGELSAGASRPKKRRKSSAGSLMTLLVLVVAGGGAGYAYLNKDALMPMVNDLMGGPAPIKPAPGDLPEVTTGPALPATPTDASASAGQGATVAPADPTVPVVGADAAASVPAVPTVGAVATDPNAAPSVPAPAPGASESAGAGVSSAPSVPEVSPVVGTEPPPMDVGFSDGLPQPEAVANTGTPKDLVAVATPSVTAPVTPSVTPPKSSDPIVPDLKGSGSVTVDPAPKVPTVDKAPAIAVTAPAKANDAKDKSSPTTPNEDAANAGDLGGLAIPDLPDVQKSMDGKDEFIESKNTLDDLSDMRTPGLNLTDEQKAAGLGVSVGEVQKKQTKSPTPAPSATGEMTPEVAVMGDIEGKIAAANRALDLERFQAAYDMFSDLYKINPRDERVLMGRAVSLQKLGRVDEAITAYDDLLAIAPDNPDVMVNALGLVRQKNPTDALARLMTLRSKYPTNATIAAQIGLVNAELKNYDEGLKYLNIAADLESTNPKHFFNMAVVAERMGRVDLAIDGYERALKADALSANTNHKIDRDMIYDRLSYLRQGTATP